MRVCVCMLRDLSDEGSLCVCTCVLMHVPKCIYICVRVYACVMTRGWVRVGGFVEGTFMHVYMHAKECLCVCVFYMNL